MKNKKQSPVPFIKLQPAHYTMFGVGAAVS